MDEDTRSSLFRRRLMVIGASAVLIVIAGTWYGMSGRSLQLTADRRDSKNDVNGSERTTLNDSHLKSPSPENQAVPNRRVVQSSENSVVSDPIHIKRFNDLKECYQYFGAVDRSSNSTSDNPLNRSIPSSIEDKAKYDAELQSQQEELDRAAKASDLCRDMQSKTRDGSIYSEAYKAALTGDDNAADCYASGAFTLDPEVENSPMTIDEFKRNAVQLMDQQFKKGDWRAILMYQHYYAPDNIQFGLASNIRSPDVVQSYRFSKLRSLLENDQDRAAVEIALPQEATALSSSEIVESDRWARAMKDTYFSKVSDIDFSNAPLCLY